MEFRVKFVHPRTQYQRLKQETDAAILGCLASGDLIYRRQLRDFEEQFAAFVGVRYAVGVSSGYHALHLSLLAAGVGPGDEVITVGHTFLATVSAIVHCGATPVLIDVGADYNMDPDFLESAITARTKALLPVHLNGRLCDMGRIMAAADRHGLAVIEDAAQALGGTYDGTRAGGLGIAGCFSFYPFKILGGFGDGGAVTTNDAGVARQVSRLRYNGEDRDTGEYHGHGYTALLDNVQAAVLSVKLPHVPDWIEHRRAVAAMYRRGLEGVPGLTLPHFSEAHGIDVFQNYVIRSPERDALRRHLTACSIETLVHWPKPMWAHPDLHLPDPGLPETERICREVLSLPMSAEAKPVHVDAVVAAIREHAHQPPATSAAAPAR